MSTKGTAQPLVRTPKQKVAQARAANAAARKAEADALKAQAVQLAQIVNLHIAGWSLADIGASIGASEAEVDRMLARDTARYIKSQPALRLYVRNWISERYMKMIEADWDDATDKNAADKLENQDRVMRMLSNMERLHGAAAPTQAEVKVEATPDAVEALVNSIARAQGMGYDTDIFDTVPGTVVHEAAVQSERALEVSGNQIEEGADEDGDL